MAFVIFQNVEITTTVVVMSNFVSETILVVWFVILTKNVKLGKNVSMEFAGYPV